jgi:two-component system OmpR family response regulator
MLAAADPYDVIILDRMLPQVNGLTILRAIRAAGVKTPVLILTALGGIDDRVEGLEAGGDDYLVKPFAFAELLARLNALARRPAPRDAPTAFAVADLQMDLLSRRVIRAGTRIDLQPREFQILEYLMRNAGRLVTRTMLLEAVWDFHFDPTTNIVETHISRLRSKVDRDFGQELIHTVRGAGYCLREPE